METVTAQPRAVKFHAGSADVLDILAVPFGGPIGGKDLEGEFFSARTDLCPEWFPGTRPLLYEHGLVPETGVGVIGHVDASTARKTVDGWWVQAELDRANAYFDSIKRLIERGVLHASAGALPHLVQTTKSGEILRWPWVELSLTPIPCNPLAQVKPATAAKHYKAIGVELPDNWTDASRLGDVAAKAGRVLSAANEQRLRNALASLEAVLASLRTP